MRLTAAWERKTHNQQPSSDNLGGLPAVNVELDTVKLTRFGASFIPNASSAKGTEETLCVISCCECTVDITTM